MSNKEVLLISILPLSLSLPFIYCWISDYIEHLAIKIKTNKTKKTKIKKHKNLKIVEIKSNEEFDFMKL